MVVYFWGYDVVVVVLWVCGCARWRLICSFDRMGDPEYLFEILMQIVYFKSTKVK